MDIETILWWVAWVTTGLFALKVILMFAGAHVHTDIDIHSSADAHDMADDFQVISVLSVLTMLMMGSWCALAGLESFRMGIAQSLGLGLVGGVTTAFLVSFIMYKMRKLEADGTLRNFDAKGLRGTVYTAIPAAGQGEGQVTLEVKGRRRNFRAVSLGDKIESFKSVEVADMTSDHVMRAKVAN